MNAGVVLFPLGVRLSTWIVLGVFAALGLRDRRFWFAGAVWLAGFEAVYDVSMWILHPQQWYLNIFFFGASVLTVVWFSRAIPAPDLRVMAVVAAIWIAWVAAGFHVNQHTMVGFDPAAEALNEAAKTLWAVAYLLPLWKLSRRRSAEAPQTAGLEPRPDV